MESDTIHTLPHLLFEYEDGAGGELCGITARTSEHWLSLGKENREAAAYLLSANGFRATRDGNGKTLWTKKFAEPVPKKNIGEKAARELESLSRLERKLDKIGANFTVSVYGRAAQTEPNAIGMQETDEGTEIQTLREPGSGLARRLADAGFEYREPETKGGLGKWLRAKTKDAASEAASWTLDKGFPAAARGLSDLLKGMVSVSECNYGPKTERALMAFVEKAERTAKKNMGIAAGRDEEICFSHDVRPVYDSDGKPRKAVSEICFGADDIPAETRQLLADSGYIQSRRLDGMRTWVRDIGSSEILHPGDDVKGRVLAKELNKTFAQTEKKFAAAAQERERAELCAGYARKQKEQQRGQGFSR